MAHQIGLPRFGSDHVPICLELRNHVFKPSQFKFESSWCLTDDLQEKIKCWWEEQCFAKHSFSSIRERKRHLRHSLDELDIIRESRPLSAEELRSADSLSLELSLTLRQEEFYWRQRSRVKWLREGDANTKFFHSVANGRCNHNHIAEVDFEDNSVKGDADIGRIFTTFFRGQFGTKRDFRFLIDWNVLLANKPRINLEDLKTPFSSEEIFAAISKLGADKAPGPDGFPILFFRKYWHILKTDLCKIVIDRLVDHSQSAFIKGRSILDNVVAAEEIIFGLQQRGLGGNVVKVDFAKAFDMVDWDFLLEMLEARGFGTRWRQWIASLLRSSKSSILINGSPEGYVRYQRGLRQGDPLSPLLFVLAADDLSTMFNQALDSRVFFGVPLGNQGHACHLQYADDLIILTAGGAEDLRIIKLILGLFEDVLPISYMGVPIAGRRPRRQDWEVLIHKIHVRLTSWKANFFSLGGRLTLINSVLSALPTYWMSIFRLPKWVSSRIDRIRRDFLWSGPDIDHPKCHLVSWQRLCLPREQGGWGIINLVEFNSALLGKWWNLFLSRHRRCSFFWQGLYQSLEAFTACLQSVVVNGESTLFWLDNWMEGCAPRFRWGDEFRLAANSCRTIKEILGNLLSGDMSQDPLLIAARSNLSPSSGTGDQDQKSWKLTVDGFFTVKSFYRFLIDRGKRCKITPLILECFVPRKISVFCWLVWDKKILMLDKLFSRRCNFSSTATCLHCFSNIESVDHLFFTCPVAQEIWRRLAPLFGFQRSPFSSVDLWEDWIRIPAAPARDLHKLEESISAVRRFIQFSGPSSSEEQVPDVHDDISGYTLLLMCCLV
ncbi:uncharacterized protein LOC120257303 [Dioscorea cayenensis subsp. rotundata]|uniref:Uncharacterized protein LOC120257303 n=1 Tax=Dioscorea cayennensis subsp. rotundata TaxID=55577 RepID=A0AB40B105_DIOCR|nr:uncharacterized protein LOC120257303 [Dioscorea cayenensis subsp. rotundata]